MSLLLAWKRLRFSSAPGGFLRAEIVQASASAGLQLQASHFSQGHKSMKASEIGLIFGRAAIDQTLKGGAERALARAGK